MTEQMAYDAGVDCAKNGANTTNCHFTIFATPELTAAWERGKTDAEFINNKTARDATPERRETEEF
jgi:hypothetical protein